MIQRYLLAAAVAFAAMAWMSTRSALIDKGETRALAKVEKRNNAVVKKAAKATEGARRAAAAGSSGGLSNPNYRD